MQIRSNPDFALPATSKVFLMMSSRKPSQWLFADAVDLLARAERLQRHFFALASAPEPIWEPPVDVVDIDHGVVIEVALPGVEPADVEVAFEATGLLVRAERRSVAAEPGTRIRRLELPFGRFERRIPLPGGHYDVARNDLLNGCLRLVLRKRD
jgi:HSP20 family protein